MTSTAASTLITMALGALRHCCPHHCPWRMVRTAAFSVAVVLMIHATLAWFVRRRKRSLPAHEHIVHTMHGRAHAHHAQAHTVDWGGAAAAAGQSHTRDAHAIHPLVPGTRAASATLAPSATYDHAHWRLPPRARADDGDAGRMHGADVTSCALGGDLALRTPSSAVAASLTHTIVFVGDVSFARDIHAAGVNWHGSNFSFVFKHVAHITRGADFAVANLESILVKTELKDAMQAQNSAAGANSNGAPRGISLHGHEGGIAALKWAGFDAVSLAHNHALDGGEVSLATTSRTLSLAGVAAVGLSIGHAAAQPMQRPLIHRLPDGGARVGMLAYCTVKHCTVARANANAGAAEFAEGVVRAQVKKLRGECDILVVIMHWGTEYELNVDPFREKVAVMLATLGVDVIVGHHPHVLQAHGRIGKSAVIFSAGNFVFDSHVCRDSHGVVNMHGVSGSPGCSKMQARKRLAVARATRSTRIYRLHVARTRLVKLEYLPCSINVSQGEHPAYLPVPAGSWTDVWYVH